MVNNYIVYSLSLGAYDQIIYPVCTLTGVAPPEQNRLTTSAYYRWRNKNWNRRRKC